MSSYIYVKPYICVDIFFSLDVVVYYWLGIVFLCAFCIVVKAVS